MSEHPIPLPASLFSLVERIGFLPALNVEVLGQLVNQEMFMEITGGTRTVRVCVCVEVGGRSGG